MMDVYDFPQCTPQMERPLAGVIAFIDVRSGPGSTENRGPAIGQHLQALGATVAVRFTKDVTHLVFKDGYAQNSEKAEKRKLFVVSPLWVDACRKVFERVSEAKYPVVSKATDSPTVLGKLKRYKSMQPKPINEAEISRSVERKRKQKSTMSGKEKDVLCSGANSVQQEGESEGDVCEESGHSWEEVVPSSPVDMFADNTEDGEGMDLHPALSDFQVAAEKGVVPGTVCGEDQWEERVGGEQNSKEKDNSWSKGVQKTTKKVGVLVRKRGRETGMGPKRRVIKKGVLTHLPSVMDERGAGSNTPTSKVNQVPDGNTSNGHTSAQENEPAPILKQIEVRVGTTSKAKRPKLAEVNKCRGQMVAPAVVTKKKKRRSKMKSHFTSQKPTLVLTSCHRRDQEVIQAVVKKLGKYELSNVVTEATTHMVSGATRRTLNTLAASVWGCWVLSVEWVWKSLEAGEWLEENPYEMKEAYPVAHEVRKQKESAGHHFRPSLFSETGLMYISLGTTPPADQLHYLIHMAGGKTCGSRRKADVVIGSSFKDTAAPCVTEQWVLDSVTANTLLPMDDYPLSTVPAESAVGNKH